MVNTRSVKNEEKTADVVLATAKASHGIKKAKEDVNVRGNKPNVGKAIAVDIALVYKYIVSESAPTIGQEVDVMWGDKVHKGKIVKTAKQGFLVHYIGKNHSMIDRTPRHRHYIPLM